MTPVETTPAYSAALKTFRAFQEHSRKHVVHHCDYLVAVDKYLAAKREFELHCAEII